MERYVHCPNMFRRQPISCAPTGGPVWKREATEEEKPPAVPALSLAAGTDQRPLHPAYVSPPYQSCESKRLAAAVRSVVAHGELANQSTSLEYLSERIQSRHL
jgi:hypothetical protein